MSDDGVLFNTLIRIADDHLILGHRLSEWCGHAPMLEEDLALPNIALDLLGQARVLYTYAGEVEGKGRSEDDLAYMRLEQQYQNLLIAELPNGDFAQTVLRQFYFSSFMALFWQGCGQSINKTLREISTKADKETQYHIRHSAEWVIRLGDGTDESTQRMMDAIEFVSPYCAEMFLVDDQTRAAIDEGLIPNVQQLKEKWKSSIDSVFQEAALQPFDSTLVKSGGRNGRHLEDMGHLLAQLQYMQRTYPGLAW